MAGFEFDGEASGVWAAFDGVECVVRSFFLGVGELREWMERFD